MVLEMTSCLPTTGYLRQSGSRFIPSYAVTMEQWVNSVGPGDAIYIWFCLGHHDTRSNNIGCPATPIWHFIGPQIEMRQNVRHFNSLVLGFEMKFQRCNIQVKFTDWWLMYLLWNCPDINIIRNLTDDKSDTGSVIMAWCRLADSHNPNGPQNNVYRHGAMSSLGRG